MFVCARDTAANVMYYAMGGSGRKEIQMKMAFFEIQIRRKVRRRNVLTVYLMAQRSPVPNLGRKCSFGREIQLRM